MRVITFSVVVALAVLTARAASAQTGQGQAQDPNDPSDPRNRTQTQRPYRGIFGGGVGSMGQLLTLGLNMGGGFDSSVYIDQRQDPNAILPVRRQQSGFTSGSANLSYSLNRSSISASAGGGISAAYYPVLDDPIVHRYFANAGGSWRISTRAGLSGGLSMAYRPVNHLASLPGIGINDPTLGPSNPFDNTVGSQGETYRTESADVDFNYRVTDRIGTNVGYGVWRTVSPDHDRDANNHGLSGRVSVGLTKDLALYTGYRLNSNTYAALEDEDTPAERVYSHNVDFGLHFSKALSLSRKTNMSFGVGTSTVSDGADTNFGLTGNVRLMRELARTWHATFDFSRDAQFVETFREPVFSDSLSATVAGLISRRLRADAGLGYSFGTVGLSNLDNGYGTFYTSAGVGFGITRHLNSGVRYSYINYRFDRGVSLPADLFLQRDRHGVNAYLTTWLPLFSRTRRP